MQLRAKLFGFEISHVNGHKLPWGCEWEIPVTIFAWGSPDDRYQLIPPNLAPTVVLMRTMVYSGWWFGTCCIFPSSWECHHPN